MRIEPPGGYSGYSVGTPVGTLKVKILYRVISLVPTVPTTSLSSRGNSRAHNTPLAQLRAHFFI
jgi:hypothetical protein